jgi:hypothetical protein
MGKPNDSSQCVNISRPWPWRFHQVLLIATFLPLCWQGMMIVHEAGHVAAAVATGGTVTRVVLYPAAISRTDVEPNPSPGVVVWAGPVAGVVLPVVVWAICAAAGWAYAYLLRFFAGFCLVANGAYIGVGSLAHVGDAGVTLQTGSPIWALWIFGAVCSVAGLYLWHGQGKYFGLGKARGRVRPAAAFASATLLVVVVLTGIALTNAPASSLTHVWWSHATQGHLAFSSWYRGMNLVEGTVWIVIAALIVARYLRNRHSALELVYASAFLTFGLSDFREAVALETWLILLKGVNLVALLCLRRVILSRYYPDSRMA